MSRKRWGFISAATDCSFNALAPCPVKPQASSYGWIDRWMDGGQMDVPVLVLL